MAFNATYTTAPPPPYGGPGMTSGQPRQDGRKILVAVFGQTGTGKSSFISKVAGRDVGVGHDLRSCTSSVTEVECMIGNVPVTLVDTPGFEDTSLSDTDVLEMIVKWMSEKYGDGALLSGILYLYRITEIRMTNSSMRNLRMLRKLCGDQNLGNVTLVTTRWDEVPEDLGRQREHQLCSTGGFWGAMIASGAAVMRHNDQSASAIQAVKTLLQKSPVAMKIQQEICVEKKNLVDTDAGTCLNEELMKLQKAHKEELTAVKDELKAAAAMENAALKKAMDENHTRIVADLKRTEEEQRRLNQQTAASLEQERRDKQALMNSFAALQMSARAAPPPTTTSPYATTTATSYTSSKATKPASSSKYDGINDESFWYCDRNHKISATHAQIKAGNVRCGKCKEVLKISEYRESFTCTRSKGGCGKKFQHVSGIHYRCSCGKRWF